MVTNYFKVCPVGRPKNVQVFPFDEQSRQSIEEAWQLAVYTRDERPQFGELSVAHKIVVWRKTATPGPWNGVPITFLSGLDEHFIHEYHREYA